MFNTLNLCNHSPFELVFGRKPKIWLDLETDPDIKVSGTYQGYYTLLNKRLHYLQNLLQNFKLKHLALINKEREYFQYNSRDLVYLISPLTFQLKTASRKVAIKYVGPLVIYKIVDPHNYLLMTIDGKLLRGLFEHERLKASGDKNRQRQCHNFDHIKKGYELCNIPINLKRHKCHEKFICETKDLQSPKKYNSPSVNSNEGSIKVNAIAKT